MRLSPLVVAAAGGVAAFAAVLTAANTVPATNVGRIQQAITANDLKPAACAGITLTTVVAGTNGTNGNDLLLGPGTAATLKGNNGDDCIVGGAGDDSLNGGPGTDVCIGGPGTDTFTGSCETQIQ